MTLDTADGLGVTSEGLSWNNGSVETPEPESQDARLLEALEGLLSMETVGLFATMQQAAQQVAGVLNADKVDVFLATANGDALLAVGTSSSEMARVQKALGLDRLSLAGGGLTVRTFVSGRSHLSGHADQDPDELRSVWHDLGVRASIGSPLELSSVTRGVLQASSIVPEFFTERDKRFLEAVARWIGLTGQRAAHFERLAERVAEESLRVAAVALIDLLTPRQQEVAALITNGLTNSEIAERLVLTRGTVANHVGAILDRLGLRSRSQVAVWASERGLREHNDNPASGS